MSTRHIHRPYRTHGTGRDSFVVPALRALGLSGSHRSGHLPPSDHPRQQWLPGMVPASAGLCVVVPQSFAGPQRETAPRPRRPHGLRTTLTRWAVRCRREPPTRRGLRGAVRRLGYSLRRAAAWPILLAS